MKFTFKENLRILVLGLISLCGLSSQAQFAVVFSGHPQPWQQGVVNRFIDKYQLVNSNLIHYDYNNQNCEISKEAILQICFTKSDAKVIRYQQKRIKKTLARYLKYAQTEKAHTMEGQL